MKLGAGGLHHFHRVPLGSLGLGFTVRGVEFIVKGSGFRVLTTNESVGFTHVSIVRTQNWQTLDIHQNC